MTFKAFASSCLEITTEIFNSDSEYYQGTNMGNLGSIQSQQNEWEPDAHTLHLTLPPLAAIVLKLSN